MLTHECLICYLVIYSLKSVSIIILCFNGIQSNFPIITIHCKVIFIIQFDLPAMYIIWVCSILVKSWLCKRVAPVKVISSFLPLTKTTFCFRSISSCFVGAEFLLEESISFGLHKRTFFCFSCYGNWQFKWARCRSQCRQCG